MLKKLFFVILLLLCVATCQPFQNKKETQLPKNNLTISASLIGFLLLLFAIPTLIYLCSDDNKNMLIGGEVYVETSKENRGKSKPVTNQINLQYGNPDQDNGYIQLPQNDYQETYQYNNKPSINPEYIENEEIY
ncbi:tm2 domain-containing protein [Anaeramoeba flamelloides]|uniref:Tm2 domain-containing protein n=1 Tax=Anaeramoeba flamelloides TaxID=1746091 RepID=A0AAV7YML1_9EUKA|nr:tm2 domain-containing protein [Anaeramoeba flamelloides]KAJ6253981.1 tm2 domain-containing protein [Anaeramoeba flamelloides]